MNAPETKKLYRMIAQKEGITITLETAREMTAEEAEVVGGEEFLKRLNKSIGLKPFITMPITTQERWDDGYINFCPRCGTNISEYDYENHTHSDCPSCDAVICVHIEIPENDQ